MTELRMNPHLLRIPRYIAGKSADQLPKSLKSSAILKLCSNENPLGPSPLALQALQNALENTHRYPGGAEARLRQKLASYHGNGLTEEHFIIGNGATDVLRMIAQGFIFDGGEAMTCSVTFPLYALLTTMFGGRPVLVPPRPDLHIDLPAIAQAITADTRLIWLCNPNNPSGLTLAPDEVDAFLNQVPPHVPVVFDQAYIDFVTEPEPLDAVRYVRQDRNVIVVYSFSKTSGLANLRVGYGIALPDTIDYLARTVLPFNTGALALEAAAASLDDQAFRDACRTLVQHERAALVSAFSMMGLKAVPSQANFVLLLDPPGGALSLVNGLLNQGIIVRPMDIFGLPNAVRISIGHRRQNQRLLSAIQETLPVTITVPATRPVTATKAGDTPSPWG